jgi:hypothetical protein
MSINDTSSHGSDSGSGIHRHHSISELGHEAWEALHVKYHKLFHKKLDYDVEEIHHESPAWEHFVHRLKNYRNDLRIDYLKAYILMLNFVRDFIWSYL